MSHSELKSRAESRKRTGGKGARRAANRTVVDRARDQILVRIEHWLEGPMVALSFVWLVVTIVQFVHGDTRALSVTSDAIWIAFILDFLLRLLIAPKKLRFLRHNWLIVLSLALPALRVARVARLLRVIRAGGAEIRLARIVTAINRGMAALGSSLGRRGFRYVLALTVVVLALGAAGMLGLERQGLAHAGLTGYGGALWWTAMLLTTIGSQFWPTSAAGELLCLLLSIYALGVLGYFTAALASFFVDRDTAEGKSTGQSNESKRREPVSRSTAFAQTCAGARSTYASTARIRARRGASRHVSLRRARALRPPLGDASGAQPSAG